MVKAQISDHILCGKQIRKELKEKFTKTRFKVVSYIYSGGNSIDIYWNNGPTRKQVDNIIQKYRYGHTAGMKDSYDKDNKRKNISQIKFIFINRNLF